MGFGLFQILLCCVVGLASIALCRAAPQLGSFAFQNKRDPASLNPSYDGFPGFGNDIGSLLNFASYGQGFPTYFGAHVGLPPDVDFGSGGVSRENLVAGLPLRNSAPGISAPDHAGLSAFAGLGSDVAYPFSAPVQFGVGPNVGSQQTYAISADGQLVPVPPQSSGAPTVLDTPVQSTLPAKSSQNSVAVDNALTAAKEYPSKSSPPLPTYHQAEQQTDYNNDGINTTPSPPVFGSVRAQSVPDLALVLKPPPRPTNLEYSGSSKASPPAVSDGFRDDFAGNLDSDRFSGSPRKGGVAGSSPGDSDNSVLPGRPFNYNTPFPTVSPSRQLASPINVFSYTPPFGSAAAGLPNTEQKSNVATVYRQSDPAPAVQTYATSVSPTAPSGVYGNAPVYNNGGDSGTVAVTAYPQPNYGPVQSYSAHGVTSVILSNNNNNSPNSVSGDFYRGPQPINAAPVRNNNDYSPSVPVPGSAPNHSNGFGSLKPESVTAQTVSGNGTPNSFSVDYRGNLADPITGVVHGGSANPLSANSYSDANAVQNSFNELASYLSHNGKSVNGNFGDSNSITANSKRESFEFDKTTLIGG